MYNSNCIFCKIVKGEIPSYKIYEDEKVVAFLDIKRDAYGHTLVIPKKHCTNIFDCDEDYLAAIAIAVQKISRHYVDDCGFSGVDVLNANGVSAQQTVFHYHVHIVPRKDADGINIWPLGGEDCSIDQQKVLQHLTMIKND